MAADAPTDRTRKAALSAVFGYAHYALGVVSGFVVFPVVLARVGAHDYGLWLMSGELVGYLLLGDLGVFAVLPWLVAARHGAGDSAAVGRYLADALAVGTAVGLAFVALAAGVWFAGPGGGPNWEKLRGPLALLLLLTGAGFPLRAFSAVLTGLQDVTFVGVTNAAALALTVGTSIGLILTGWGLHGLALAAGVPPLVAGVASGARVFRRREQLGGWQRPRARGCARLIAEGFGAWLGGLGVRLMAASGALIFAALGRPDWATVAAATGKAAQTAQPLCGMLPDSALVGLSQLRGEGRPGATHRAVACLLLLYLLIPGAAAVALLAANRWFVRLWVGPALYAGDYVNALLAAQFVLGAAANGLFKVVGVAGYRVRVGAAAVAAGAVSVGLGYGLGAERGIAGVVEAGLTATAGVVLPCGVLFAAAVYGLPRRAILRPYAAWGLRAGPVLALAGAAGWYSGGGSAPEVVALTAALGAGYAVAVRPLLASAPWPARVRTWLARFRLIPSVPAGSAS